MKEKEAAAAQVDIAEDPSIPSGRQAQTQLIRAFHALEKQLASPGLTDPEERKKLEAERERLGGLQGYQEASKHGGDKVRWPSFSCFAGKQIDVVFSSRVVVESRRNGSSRTASCP